jgi:peptidyl-Lys metalloendopeptidase
MRQLFHGLMAVIASACGVEAHAASHLVATLRDSTPEGFHDQVLVTLTLTNDGDEPVHVFKAATPFIETGGRLPRDQFEVTDAFGHKARYRGSWVNFGHLPASLFEIMQPGETLERTVDLTKEYDYGNGGPFTIRYDLSMEWALEPTQSTAEQRAAFLKSDQRMVSSNEIVVIAPPFVEPVPTWLSEGMRADGL